MATGTWYLNNPPTVNSAIDFSINGSFDAAGLLAASLTTTPASGTPRTVGETVSVANASGTRDDGKITARSVTQGLNGTFSVSNLATNALIAPNTSNTGTVSFDGTNVLNGVVATGTLSLTLAGNGVSGATVNGLAAPQTVNYPLSTTISGNISNVSNADTRTDFGTEQTALLLSGGSYVNLSSTTVGGTTVGSGGAGNLGTTATIIGGAPASDDAIVEMKWRTRNLNEVPGSSETPPFGSYVPGIGLASDVVDLTGIAAIEDGGTFHGSVETDVFVLRLSYNEAAIEAITGGSEEDAAAAGLIALGYLDLGADGTAGTDDDRWALAVDGNFNNDWDGIGAGTGTQFFNRDYIPGTDGLLVGRYGVDTASNTVWAILDHNSQFAAIPEPTSLGLIGGVSAVGLLRRRRTTRKSRSSRMN